MICATARLWLSVAAIVAFVVSGSVGPVTATSRAARASVRERVAPLFVVPVKTPRIHNPNLRTAGTYPQVALPGVELRAVNDAIRDAVVRDEEQFITDWPREKINAVPGIYSTSPRLRLISVSTVVVSMLVPKLTLLFGGGNDGSRWLSVTVRVATARPVAIDELFTRPSEGLKALAASARRRVVASQPCVRASIARDAPFYSLGFRPTIANYQNFALLPRGLAVGFPQQQIGSPVCGRIVVIVPYFVVRPYMSSLGKELVRGVRRPQ